MFLRVLLVGSIAAMCYMPAVAQQPAEATYQNVAFAGTNSVGAHPLGGVVLGPDGNYYGTASTGGDYGGGTVLKVTPEGVLSVLASFSYDQGNPEVGLIVGSDGNLYGTTAGSTYGQPNSTGTIFRVTLDGQLTILATFVNNDQPVVHPNKLLQASDGNFYGTTAYGGANRLGSVFRMTPDGTVTTLVSFGGSTSGGAPYAGLVQGDDGNFYGATSSTVFRMSPAGVLTTLATFSYVDSIGNSADAELTKGPDGTFYGVTSAGGPQYGGSVFKVAADGTVSALAPLPFTSVTARSALVFGDDGNLYGTTTDEFYRVSLAGERTTVVDFNATFAGRQARGPILKLPSGDFLATTYTGGTGGQTGNQFGTVVRLAPDGTHSVVSIFPALIGQGFSNQLTESPAGEIYGTFSDDLTGGFFSNFPHPGVFKLDAARHASPVGSLAVNSQGLQGSTSSAMVAAGDGALYGTMSQGGNETPETNTYIRPSGFIYRVRPTGAVSRVYQFTGTTFGDAASEHGEMPQGVTRGDDGNLYGVTRAGGANARGTFFKMDLDRNLTTLASFTDSTGTYPGGPLILADSLFYGVTSMGGTNNTGTFFSVTPEGQISVLLSFPADFYISYAGRLIRAKDGNFYGTASDSTGKNARVFRLTKDGALSTFASFGDDPAAGYSFGVIEASDGNFYSVTQDSYEGSSHTPGAIFRFDRAGVATVVHRFSEAEGWVPAANLMQASDGYLYGTTAQGGPSRQGVVYRLSILPPRQLVNISTRLRVQNGDSSLIGGFIVTGNAPKKVLVRAIGPSLQQQGVADVLNNPVLELRGPDGSLISQNDDWKESQRADIEATLLAPSDDRESAIIATLTPGGYTAVITGKDGATGTGLVEVYDVNAAADSKLANISTRGLVQTGDNILIGGLIVGDGGGAAKVIVRALGPSLQQAGVADALADPILELRNGNGDLIVANDNWQDDPDQAAEITAAGIPPSNSRESAIATELPAGANTMVVRGKENTTGVGLIEVYNIE